MRYHESVEDAEGQRWYDAAAEQPDTASMADPNVQPPDQDGTEARLRAGDSAEDLARSRWFAARAAKLVRALIN